MIEDLKYLSKTTKKTLRQCLNILSIQELLVKICNSEYKSIILLNGDFIFALNNGFISDEYMDLDICIITDDVQSRNILKIFNEIISVEPDNSIFNIVNTEIIDEKKEAYGKRYELQIVFKIEGVKIHLVININAGDLKQEINEIKEPKLYSNLYSVDSIYACSIERILAERFYGIIKKQIVYDSKLFYDINNILSNYILDGRKLKESLQTIFKINEYKPEENDFWSLIDLKNNSMVEKRWTCFLNSINKEKISLDVVIDRIEKAFWGIWDGLFNDKAFFGSWMPKLNRYID